jgi:hypothetical protein
MLLCECRSGEKIDEILGSDCNGGAVLFLGLFSSGILFGGLLIDAVT